MCCGSTERLDLPPAVIEMLARYRGLKADRGWDWGDDRIDMFRWARFGRLGDVFAAFARTGDWLQAVRSVVGLDPPSGIVVVRITADDVSVHCGPPRPAIAGTPMPVDVVVDSAVDRAVHVVVAGRAFTVPERGAGVETVDLDADAAALAAVTVDGRAVSLAAAVRPVAGARLRLRSSPMPARWSVTDGTGGAWFPAGMLPKWDVDDRPFFHGDDVELEVPAEELTVTCARGLEHRVVEMRTTPAAGDVSTLDCEPPRLFDPAADGWYGGRPAHPHELQR